jgi:hypothetical protein
MRLFFTVRYCSAVESFNLVFEHPEMTKRSYVDLTEENTREKVQFITLEYKPLLATADSAVYIPCH